MICILIGSSGSGKSSIAMKLIENHGYREVKTCTTRDRREGEPEDAYYFMTDAEFANNIAAGAFAEYDVYGNHYYGILKSELETEEKLVCVITPNGADAIMKVFPDAFIVQVGASMKTSVMRAINREKELTPGIMDAISKRAILDYWLFENPYYDFKVENEDGASLDEIAAKIADVHEHPDIKAAMKDMKKNLDRAFKLLEEYSKSKKGDRKSYVQTEDRETDGGCKG